MHGGGAPACAAWPPFYARGTGDISRQIRDRTPRDRTFGALRPSNFHGTQGALDPERGEQVIEKLDFLVRFWELKARHATLGQPLAAREQVELLSLMQLVGGDCAMPDAGPVHRGRGSLPAQLIGDGTMKAIEIRSVSASALLVACASSMAAGSP